MIDAVAVPLPTSSPEYRKEAEMVASPGGRRKVKLTEFVATASTGEDCDATREADSTQSIASFHSSGSVWVD
jgi:hypothetical protein